ncbi:MAG: hypothetical protein AAFR59_17080, partial [Bacteroidota bacterium]
MEENHRRPAIQNLLDYFISHSNSRPDMDLSVFRHPLAEQVSWSPLVLGGTSFQTHNFKEFAVDKVGFSTSGRMYMFSLLFTVIGASVTIVPFVVEGEGAKYIASVAGLIFFGLGLYMLYTSTQK